MKHFSFLYLRYQLHEGNKILEKVSYNNILLNEKTIRKVIANLIDIFHKLFKQIL